MASYNRARLERLSDALPALLPLMVAWISILDGPVDDRPVWIVMAIACGQSLALAWCRRFPLTVLLVVMALETVLVLADMEIFVGFLAAASALGMWGKPVQQRVGLTIGLAVLAAGMVVSIGGGAPPGFALVGIASVAVMFVGFWMSGRLGAGQRSRIRELELAAERERALLARELHDILNHAVTAMVLDADAAAETSTPEEAKATLRRVASTGRNSLGEMRRLLGVLRKTSASADHDPLVVPPGLDRLDELLASMPGLRITLLRDGVANRLDASLEHAAYRVVQESLTNVVKHVGPTEVTVRLSYRPDRLSVAVTNTGYGLSRNSGTGMGLVGMRERVELVGGRLTAGPTADGGFSVEADLPCSV